MTRTVPAKSGMSNATSALPSAPTVTMPEKSASGGPVGGLPCSCGAGVAAGADLAARALHAVDQLAVEIADFRRERALAEIVVVRRRRLVVGEIEDADIDRGDRRSRASSPAASPSILTGTRSVVFGRNSAGSFRSSASVFAARSIENHCTPMARPGMRCAGASSGRRKVATT